jgi:hypothetical protein
MEMNRKAGAPMLLMGLILLCTGILVLVFIPQWGDWIKNYPQTVLQRQLPAEAQAAKGMMQFALGPLIQQIGDYLRTVGYYVGSLITLISLGSTFLGFRLLTRGYIFNNPEVRG